ncbi:PAS domain-containing sensor histidine kinase [Hymenobacter sublimis]|uniref:histidine kinase n=1 Tax=Hymenobacter sublimis TaxID=2933777 RepID=A0ABY4JBD1_9BACT|nr:PAS domain-containing sensor histidine kinase [Hymenobacter sublimis]UPL49248.1 PAS domain-containing sensor histidine kinase [Hymenobacter sublimis]
MIDYAHLFAPLAAHDSVVYFCYCPTQQRVLYVSEAYERELGGQVAAVNEELPGWLARLHPDDYTYLTEQLCHAATGQLVQDLELRLHTSDNKTQWLCLTAVGYLPGGGNATGGMLISGHLRDVTAARAMVELANRYQVKKNSMLEILSHDLAAPMVLVQQMSGYIKEKVEGLHDEQLNVMLEEMHLICQQGVNLIRDFVDQEFMESSQVDLHLTRIDLAERLRILVANYQEREQATARHFSFETSHPSIYAEIDENKFLQAINNLLSNSLKFTPDGGLLRVTLRQQPTRLVITVTDTGIGIPRDVQPELFERFTPARRPGLRGEKSTGLGMSIIKTIVELHQGRIWFESEEGRGTTFFIELPLSVAG